jgi:hypothetical protein
MAGVTRSVCLFVLLQTLVLLAWESWNCCGIQSNNVTDSSAVFMLKLGEEEVRSELSGLVYFSS